jgi:hypothetical protein
MRKGAILAGLITAAVVVGNSAQSAEDRNRPKCDFHVFTDMNDHWALTEGTAKRKWLVMNVGDAAVLISGSEITTPGHREHEELIATGQSTIATMKYGQPQISLAPAGDNAMAPGNMTTGDNVTDASAAPAATAAPPVSMTAGASTSADATSTTSANNTMASDTATAGGSSAVGASTSAGAKTTAAAEPAPTTKTTVVICRFFERKR